MPFDGSSLTIALAFLGGLVAFFSPCLFPLIPAYVSYFGGVSVSQRDGRQGFRSRVFTHSVLFALGFILIFVILGMTASSVGRAFLVHRELVLQIGGVLFILFGVFMLEIIRIPWLYRTAQTRMQSMWTRSQGLNSFLIGLTFGFAWTPCIGPVLATILFFASQAETAAFGTLMLFTFGLGIAVPFIIIALLMDRLSGWIRKFSRATVVVQRIAGVILIVLGALMITNQYHIITSTFLRFTNFQPAI